MLTDIRYALRSLKNHPGFTAVAVITLALGIGANTTIFSAVYAVLLDRPNVAQPEQLRIVRPVLQPADGAPDTLGWWSYPMYEAFRDGEPGLASVAAYTPNPRSYTLATGDDARRVALEFVSAGYFEVLGVSPVQGRGFTPDEDITPNTHPVAVVSHDLWRSAFGADPAVVGREIHLDALPLTVVGVMPPGFAGLSERADLWVPMMMAPPLTFARRLEGTLSFWHAVVGRVAPGAGDAAALAARLSSVARGVADAIPLAEVFGDVELAFVPLPLAATRVDPTIRRALLVLLGAVGFVLLIACANVANLMLARGARRAREMGVRVALGVGRLRLARQLIVESVTLGVLGGVAALLVAVWGLDALRALRPPSLTGTVDLEAVRVSAPVLAFNFAAAVVAGILFGVIPSLVETRADARTLLAGDGGGRRRRGPRGALVAVEVALALVLLVGAGLLLRSLAKLNETPLGFEPRGVLTAFVNIPRQAYVDDEPVAFFEEAMIRLRDAPGVRRTAMGNCLPVVDGCDRVGMVVAGAITDPDAAAPAVWMNMVSGDYFQTLGIPLLAGRAFDERDRGDAPRVAVVNEAAARRYWPDGAPLGERIQLSVGWGGEDDFAEIVGVVGDVKLGGVTEPVQPGVYLAYRQFSYRSNYLVVQADGDPGVLTGAVRAVVRELDPTLSAWDIRSMERWIGDSTARTRFSGTLLLAFGAIALVLAAVGIYGVIAFAVAGRTREIGVRMAVGARDGDVMRLLFREGLRFTTVGLAVGLGGTLLLTRFLRSELYEVSPVDPVTIVAVLALLTAAATVAILVPARRATRIDPMEALRTD